MTKHKKATTETLKQKLMENPEFKAEYESQQPYFEIAMQIIKARIDAGLTQKQLAERLGTTQSVIARIESFDYGRINLQTLQKIADALGMRLQVQLLKEAG